MRERIDVEKRRSSGSSGGGGGGGSRDAFDSVVDLGIGYISSAVSTAGTALDNKWDKYFNSYSHENVQIRLLLEMLMPEYIKPFITPLQPQHT